MKPFRSVLVMVLSLIALIGRAQVPVMNSNPTASATVYLDFDGEYVAGTSWNWNGPIDAQAAVLSTAAITEIFNRVAEDYRIFNINITTQASVFASAPSGKRIHVIVTSTSAWYGNAGGVGFVGSFTWPDDTPVWVFSNLLGNNIKYVAEACSHEVGHSLGLQHQSSYNASCSKTAEYSVGQGSGEIGWAPIMGVGYYKNLTTWNYGPNSLGCGSMQDDIALVGGPDNGFGLRTDDHKDVVNQATNIILNGVTFSAEGIINSGADKDVFKLVLPGNYNVRLTAIPRNVGNSNEGANVDIKVSLINKKGDTLGTYNPSDLLNVGMDTNLVSGTYYLVAEGVGNINLGDNLSLGYYSIAGSFNSALALKKISLAGFVDKDIHSLNWTGIPDERLKEFVLQSSEDGKSFKPLLLLASSQFSANYQPITSQKLFYRIKALSALDGTAYYSNIIALQTGNLKGNPTQITVVKNSLQINSFGNYPYQIIQANGQLIRSGKLVKGLNSIQLPSTLTGVFLTRVFTPDQTYTEKLIKQ